MTRKTILFALAAVAVWHVPAPLAAEISAKEALAYVDGEGAQSTLVKAVMKGYADGMGWVNSYLGFRKETQPFCLPDKLKITSDQNIAILEDFIKVRPDAAEFPFGLAIMEAYIFTFPCQPRR